MSSPSFIIFLHSFSPLTFQLPLLSHSHHLPSLPLFSLVASPSPLFFSLSISQALFPCHSLNLSPFIPDLHHSPHLQSPFSLALSPQPIVAFITLWLPCVVELTLYTRCTKPILPPQHSAASCSIGNGFRHCMWVYNTPNTPTHRYRDKWCATTNVHKHKPIQRQHSASTCNVHLPFYTFVQTVHLQDTTAHSKQILIQQLQINNTGMQCEARPCSWG